MGSSFLKALGAMEIPEDVLKSVTRIEMLGNGSVRIENFSHIIQYSKDRLLLGCKTMKIEITGMNLSIKSYTHEEIIVEGNIQNVKFLNGGNC